MSESAHLRMEEAAAATVCKSSLLCSGDTGRGDINAFGLLMVNFSESENALEGV